ncbi:1696_t:CDS:2, partial [Funneliformis geosporum]
GCTVAPGFDYKDFELISSKSLFEQFPQHLEIIIVAENDAEVQKRLKDKEYLKKMAMYLEKFLLLPKITPKELVEKLTYYGLETKIVEHKNSLYLEFDPLPNRPDLFSW